MMPEPYVHGIYVLEQLHFELAANRPKRSHGA